MSHFLEIALSNAVVATLMALLVLAISRIYRRPALIHCLWLLVLLKLVTPPVYQVSIGTVPTSASAEETAVASSAASASRWVQRRQRLSNASSERKAAEELAPENATVSPIVSGDFVTADAGEGEWSADAAAAFDEVVVRPLDARVQPLPAPLPAAGLETAELPRESNTKQQASSAGEQPAAGAARRVARSIGWGLWRPVVVTLWAIGSLLTALLIVVRVARFRTLLREAQPAPAWLRSEVDELAARIGLRGVPQVLLVPVPISPRVWSIDREPQLVFPQQLLERLSDDERVSILLHELVHLRRRDHWVRVLEVFATCLYWWHPVVWWARRGIQSSEEACCDAWVVSYLAGGGKPYATALLATVDFMNGVRPAIPPVASGLGGVEPLKKRLTQIMQGTTPARLSSRGRLAVIAIAAGLLPLWPTIGQEDVKTQAAAPPATDNNAETAGENKQAREESDAPSPQQPFALPVAGMPYIEPTDFGGTPRPLQFDVQLIRSIAYSQDGGRLAAAHGNGRTPGAVRVWDVQKRQVIALWNEPKGINSVHISPDGRLVASCSLSDNLVRVRDVESGEELRTVTSGTSHVRVRFSPDGKMLATASHGGELTLWNVADGKEVKSLAALPFNLQSLAFSADGAKIAAGGGPFDKNNFGQAGVWDVATGKQLAEMKGMPDSVLGIAISADGKLVATAGRDSVARLWNSESGELVKTFDGHTSALEWVDISPDGRQLVSGSYDRTAKLWSIGTDAAPVTLAGHVGTVMSTRFSPDGKTLATAGGGKVVRLWDVATRSQIDVLAAGSDGADTPEPVLAVAYSPDGRLVASAHEDRTVRLRNPANGRIERVLEGHDDVVAHLAFSPDGATLATGSYDHTITLWNVADGKVLKSLAGHANWVFSVAFSPDGKTLASSGYDKTIRLWNVETGKEMLKLEGHSATVRSVAFSTDGKSLASGSADRTLKVWDIAAGKETSTLPGHQGSVRAVAWSPDGKTIASASEDQTVKLWNPAMGKERSTLSGHTGMVWCLAFSPQGRTLASGGFDNEIKLWDPSTGSARATLKGHTDAVTSVAFAPGTTALVTGSFDKTIRLWPATTPRVPPLTTLRVGTGEQIARFGLFTPDGQRLIVAGDWPAIHVYNMKTGQLERVLEDSRRSTTCGALLPDGQTLVTGSYGEEMYLWNVETGLLLREFKSRVGRSMHVDVSSDGKKIVIAGWDRKVCVLDADSLEPIWISPEQSLPVECAEFSPDGALVATTTGNWKEWKVTGEVKLWDAAGGEQLGLLQGHNYKIRRAAFSPDGQLLATGGSDENLKIWNVESRQLVANLPTGAAINCLQFLPDGKSIATGHYGGGLTLWNLESKSALVSYDGHEERKTIFDLQCSPDGSVLATAGADAVVRLWGTTPEPDAVGFRASSYLFKLAVSADGRRVLTGGNESPRLWDAERGELIREFAGETGKSIAVALSPDGSRALSGGDLTTVYLWDTATGKVLKQFEGHKRHVRSVAFAPDGKAALSAGLDGIAILWDLDSGRELRRFSGHQKPVQWVAFSPDGNRIVTAGAATTRLWNSKTAEELAQLPTGAEKTIVACAEFSPDGRRVLTARTDGLLVLWDASTGQEIRRYRSGQPSLQAAAFMPDGRFALSGGSDGRILLWDMEQESPLGQAAAHGDPARPNNAVKALAITADGRYVVSAGEDGFARIAPLQSESNASTADRIRRWKSEAGSPDHQPRQPQAAVKGHEHDVIVVAVSGDGTVMATGSRDRSIKLWDTAKRTVRTTIRPDAGGGIVAAAFSPDGSLLATGSYDRTVRLWRVSTGAQIAAIDKHAGIVRGVLFTPGGDQLLTASEDKTVRLWNVETQSEVRTIVDSELPIIHMDISPDGKLLVTSTGIVTPRTNGKVQLWDVKTGKALRTIEEDILSSVAFSPDGQAIACRNDRGVLTLYDVATGEPRRALSGTFGGTSVKFSPDGRTVASSYSDGTARISDVATGVLLMQLKGLDRYLWSIAHTRDGQTLIGGITGGDVLFWDLRGIDKQIAANDPRDESDD